MCPSNYYRFWDTARYLWKKSSFYHTPLAFDAPVRGFPSEYRHPLWDGNTRMVSLPMVKKFRRYVCSFWRDPRTWRTDGQADGRTDRHCMTAKTALASHRAVKIVYAVSALFISLRLCPREYWTVTDGCDISFLPSTIAVVSGYFPWTMNIFPGRFQLPFYTHCVRHSPLPLLTSANLQYKAIYR